MALTTEIPRHLEDLQNELRDAQAGGHERAAELLDRVEAYLDDEADHHTLRQALSEGVAHFEADHPRLAATIQRVIDALTAGGI